ncbi:MAG TPA: adenylate/guanylate cyclase domain-containing protein [Nocardioidaceae bacterium]|nr:adenylate/guanylate cyclase domain-containing protein [Nocardioidaceae bacterium]
MDQTVGDRLEAGRLAYQRSSWREAFELLRGAESEAPLAGPDLVLMAEAAWFGGDPDAAIDARERAHSAFLRDGDESAAAGIALLLAVDHFNRLEHAVGGGWMARAARLLEGKDECWSHGRQALNLAFAAHGQGDVEEDRRQAGIARDIGGRIKDASLHTLALQLEGMAMVNQGELDAGMALVDEATVSAMSGELDPMTTGTVYCLTIGLCRDMGDWRRAGEWTDAAERWCDKAGIAGFPGVCRVHRAEVMHVRGSWADAEREARQACQELGKYNLGISARAFYEIGEVRRRIGDLEGARTAFRQAHELHIDPEPGMSLVRFAEGDVDAAYASIKRVLATCSTNALDRSRVLPPVVEISLAAGDIPMARECVTELDLIAERYQTAGLRAAAAHARGRLEVAEGRTTDAAVSLRKAIELWHDLGAGYEIARVQIALAEAYTADGDRGGARLELEGAKATFERLGAMPDARRVDELLGGTGQVATRTAGRVARTFVFTDIVGSTSLVSALGDDAWQQMLHWHDQTLRACFDRFGGTEVRHTGDGFFIVFEQASTAVDAAVAVQRALEEHRRSHGFAPQVRIGLHQADADVRAMDYSGKGVHEAARVGALAEGGEILASLDTLDGLAVRYPVSEARSAQFKGVDEPVYVVSIDWH